jgi:WhiB family transcriptional regulator, redox-sensing transcriptional regulator
MVASSATAVSLDEAAARVSPYRAEVARLMAGGKWRQLAACRSADPDLFFPLSSTGRSLEQAAEARAICARCPVRPYPLAFALRTRQVHGIWVSLSEEGAPPQAATTSQGP